MTEEEVAALVVLIREVVRAELAGVLLQRAYGADATLAEALVVRAAQALLDAGRD